MIYDFYGLGLKREAMKDRKNFAIWYMKLLKSLRLAPLRTCLSMHECALCGQTISIGQQYRARGHNRRAHQTCLEREDEVLR